MLHCPGGCALRAPRSARSRYKVDVAVRRRFASPSFIQFVYSDRFTVSHITSLYIYKLNFGMTHVRSVPTATAEVRIPPRGETGGSATSSRHCLPPGKKAGKILKPQVARARFNTMQVSCLLPSVAASRSSVFGRTHARTAKVKEGCLP